MKSIINHTSLVALMIIGMSLSACAQRSEERTEETKQATAQTPSKTTRKMEWNKLTKEEERVIVGKGTEYPGTGKYDKFF